LVDVFNCIQCEFIRHCICWKYLYTMSHCLYCTRYPEVEYTTEQLMRTKIPRCMRVFVFDSASFLTPPSVYKTLSELSHACACTCTCIRLYTCVNIIPHYFHTTLCLLQLSLFPNTSFDNRAVTQGSKSSSQ